MNLVIARDYERGKITSWGQLGAVKAAQGTNFYATTATNRQCDFRNAQGLQSLHNI